MVADDVRPASCHPAAMRMLNGLVERFDREIAVVVGVELEDRRAVADAKAAVDDLDGQLAVGGGAAVVNALGVLQILDQTLRTHDVAGHAVAEQHEVLAAGLGAEVGVEREQAVDRLTVVPKCSATISAAASETQPKCSLISCSAERISSCASW